MNDEFESIDIEDVLLQLNANPKKGLSSEEASERLKKYGPNTLHEKEEFGWKKLFPFFWGPIPWMIEIAALLSAFIDRWPDFFVIIALLFINALVGFIQERKASVAVAALKERLALHSTVLRDGLWQQIKAKDLVLGDIVSVKMGNVVTADVKLIEGEFLSVDQSVLTKESLPVTKKAGDVIYSGTVIKLGEMTGVVIKTADQTFFGKTTHIIDAVQNKSHFQEAFMRMETVLITATLIISAIFLTVSFYRLEIEHITNDSVSQILIFFLVLVVTCFPIASTAIFSVAMASGARQLARMKAIVSRFSTIETLSSMDVLILDKTGTLTKNELIIGNTLLLNGKDNSEVFLIAALASNIENKNPLEKAIFSKIASDSLRQYKTEKHLPFDPVRKRAESTIRANDGSIFGAIIGDPYVLLHLCPLDEKLKTTVLQSVEDFANKGFKTVGVAKTDQNNQCHYLGLMTIQDPIRSDSKEMLNDIQKTGVEIKTITTDRETLSHDLSHSLGLGTDILSVGKLYHENISDVLREELIVKANGFSEVDPEHKFEIVKTLQKNHHIVGFTGESVEDSPALKQADVGIALSNATDAARLGADLILIESGLGVVHHAIEESRKTFGRMKSYLLYQTTQTFRLLLFLLLAMFIFPEHPLTAVMVILIALINDIPILMIASDHMRIHSHPVDWNIKELVTISIGYALLGVISTFGLLWIGKKIWFADMTDVNLQFSYLQTLAFMGILCGGNLTVYLTRNIGPFWQKPFPEWKFTVSTIISLLLGTLICVYGLHSHNLMGLGWNITVLAWGYLAIWFFITVIVKNFLYKMIGYKKSYLDRFVNLVEKPIDRE